MLFLKMEIVTVIFSVVIAAFVGIPMAAAYSFRDWAAIRPSTFPAWRHRIGIGSLVTILCGWFAIMVLTVLRLINDRWTSFFTDRMAVSLVLLALVAGVLLVLLALLSSIWINGEIT